MTTNFLIPELKILGTTKIDDYNKGDYIVQHLVDCFLICQVEKIHYDQQNYPHCVVLYLKDIHQLPGCSSSTKEGSYTADKTFKNSKVTTKKEAYALFALASLLYVPQ